MRTLRLAFLTAFMAIVIFAYHGAACESASAGSDVDELQVRERIVAEYTASNPDAVLEIPFTEVQLQEAEARRDDNRKNLINKVDLLEVPLQVQLNETPVNAPPYMSVIEGQIMVPLRWSADVLGATAVEWDAAARMVTIITPQDFYNLEKYGSYIVALQNPIDEYNDKILPLPEKAENLELPDLLPNRPWVLNLEQFKGEREGLSLPEPREFITITITSDDGVYEHSSVVYSIENHQGHYYLPMDWLEYLFKVRVSFNEATNILTIQTPDLERIESEIERIENILTPDTADEAVILWGRGLQTRNGALQYAALSDQLRQLADESGYVRQSYWVTGCSSPQVGPVTIESRNHISDTKIEYTITFPEIFSGQTHAIATEKMIVEQRTGHDQQGWSITQIMQSSGYGLL